MKFSKNEKKILWGLVRYPMLNDRQLSEKIKVRMSTLNAIKNKMKRSDLIKDRIIPNVEIMDYEILSVFWSPLTRPTDTRKDADTLIKIFEKYPNTYTAMVFGDTIFFLSLYKNYTQYKITELNQEVELREMGIYDGENPHRSLYPLSTSVINKNFDYTTVLERAFNIDPVPVKEEGGASLEKAREKIHHLSNKEKVILRGILENPDMPDNKIADLFNTTRQAVARHRKELLELGVIRKTRVIDYRQLGFNILTMVDMEYTKKDNEFGTAPPSSKLHLPSFFSVYGNTEGTSLSLFMDFEKYAEGKEMYTKLIKEFCTWRKEPYINLYSPSNTITIKHQDYLPLVEEFLDGN